MAEAYCKVTWNDIGEIIKAVAPVITATTAVIAAYIGLRGLDKWRAETLDKRRIDLAEDVLAGFYEARDRIRAIRSPGAYTQESEDRKAQGFESEIEKRDRDAAFIPLARYEKHRDFFSALLAKRYRLRAILGPDVDHPFDELQNIIAKLITAAGMLMRTAGTRTAGGDPYDPPSRKEWQAAIYWTGNDDSDPISQRLNLAIANLEKICQPILEGRGHLVAKRPGPGVPHTG